MHPWERIRRGKQQPPCTCWPLAIHTHKHATHKSQKSRKKNRINPRTAPPPWRKSAKSLNIDQSSCKVRLRKLPHHTPSCLLNDAVSCTAECHLGILRNMLNVTRQNAQCYIATCSMLHAQRYSATCSMLQCNVLNVTLQVNMLHVSCSMLQCNMFHAQCYNATCYMLNVTMQHVTWTYTPCSVIQYNMFALYCKVNLLSDIFLYSTFSLFKAKERFLYLQTNCVWEVICWIHSNPI